MSAMFTKKFSGDFPGTEFRTRQGTKSHAALSPCSTSNFLALTTDMLQMCCSNERPQGTRQRIRSDSGLSSGSNDTGSTSDFGIGAAGFNSLQHQEKIKYFEQLANYTEAIKDDFEKKYLDLNSQIKDSMGDIMISTNRRMRELESKLDEVALKKISSWDRQLAICQEAEDWLKNIKISCFPSIDKLQETCDMYARDIGFINLGEISFVADETKLEAFSHVGEISLRKNEGGEKIQSQVCFGRRGRREGEFKHPWGVCTDATGRILVADTGNNRIQIFNEHGTFLFGFGKLGTRAGEFNKPAGITADKQCRIIITDRNNHRVQVFTNNGRFIFMFGRKGSEMGQFEYPWGVDSNSEGHIAVCDSKNHRVQVFTKNGIFITSFAFGDYNLELNHPVCPLGVAFKPDGTLLVTDFDNRVIFKLNEDSTAPGRILHHKIFCWPYGIACNSRGEFMITDSKHGTIQVFDEQENPFKLLNLSAEHSEELVTPHGICFHPKGSVVVTDFDNNKVHVFTLC